MTVCESFPAPIRKGLHMTERWRRRESNPRNVPGEIQAFLGSTSHPGRS